MAVSALKGLLPPELLPRLTPLGGFEARVYTDGDQVYKVYRPQEAHLAALEARRMARAGLGSLVLGVAQVAGHGVLITRRFPGEPFTPKFFTPKALAALSHLFLSLHRLPEPGYVEHQELQERLELFAESLHEIPEARSLIQALKREVGMAAGVERRFCHRDAWAGNLLLKVPESPFQEGPEVLLVDWVRSGGDDPARDLALLKTGSLDLLGEEAARKVLFRLARFYPREVRERLAFYVPLTYLHDLHWFRTKKPEGFQEALEEKLPRALGFFQDCFPPRKRAC
ncbi:aminoglycoside phosphotransferase family protein [uncultured Thermus sp.]|uniref:phosphotransferase family protein n=1 Tax=uncultured Thermus sp. TaxID=157149 RepID=UPI00262F2F9C|nr:aminoglycoside phosphotransferase family protein [uncultured Thermus sp.]